MSKFNVGDKVKLIDGDLHENISKHYPKINTVGIIKLIGANGNNCLVQWPRGSTSQNDLWWVAYNKIELVKDESMTNEKIWEMLKNKMVKNGLKSIANITHVSTDSDPFDINSYNFIPVYAEDDVTNAIAIAYRSGYERAMKGRPFKFGEKKNEEEKKGGHWEPVDPKNLPKEGTRVRYSRKCGKYNDDIIKIGDTGTVVFEGIFTPLWFGMKPDKLRSGRTWFDFSEGDENCLDMWVEDDE